MTERARLAFVCSSGGGVVDALAAHAGACVEVVGVVTDRACGAEDVARRHGVAWRRIDDDHETRWARAAAPYLASLEPDVVVLLHTRRVGADVVHLPIDVWNLHPSLLPAYPGLGALARNHADARRGVAPWMGVTLHEVTDDLDAGPVLGRARFGLDAAPTIDDAAHLAFLAKVVLLLAACAARAGGALAATPQPEAGALPWIDGVAGLAVPARAAAIASLLARDGGRAWAQGLARGAAP